MNNLQELIPQLTKLAKKSEGSTRKLFLKLKKENKHEVDQKFDELHEETFASVNCLECANCCKTTSPIFYQKDIERLAKFFKKRPSQFVEEYLCIDEDQDYVLKYAPCAFLAPDNTCIAYDNRPNACREYPHTNRKKMHQIFNLTMKNMEICPAVFHIVEKLKKVYSNNNKEI